MASAEMFWALRERQFRLLWIGQATLVLGYALVPVALAGREPAEVCLGT